MNTVLHIDDDADHRLILAMLAEAWRPGVRLIQAGSASEGEKLLTEALARRERVLILCDQMMPGERGSAFLLRCLPRCRAAGIPAWLLTSFADDPDVQAAVRAGVQGAIDKPLDLGRFEEALANVVGPWLLNRTR